ncbi:MAG: glycoside hydrolase family 38 C-terminal domain-containing protein [Propionibacteriaceae bacterium]|nr:glycoside hydrolase family 38 C-terminal domain-containing protein [Propionibacteriaceae bacterium]
MRDSEGRIIKGLHPKNHWVPVPDEPGRYTWYVEAAANPLILGVPPFIPTPEGDKATSSVDPIYVLRSASLVRIHHDARELARDLRVLSGVAAQWPEDSPRRWRLAHALQEALNALDTEDVAGTAGAARALLRPHLEMAADQDALTVTAVGHAHIDTAWLWPLRETRRKVVRTLANIVQLFEAGHDFVFSLPASQHLAWLAEDAPELLQRVRHWVGEGRIAPVGAMWVEPDAVLPGGEAMCRQFLYGQQAYEQFVGRRATGMWLPDSFGYSGALPQIAKAAGAEWFLTQKISWNQVNVFPHNSFLWEGIDGTRIFTHFPPSDTYGAEVTAEELARGERRFKEKGRARETLMLFGYGDGGGGPNREMVANANRLSNTAGASQVKLGSPDEFFAAAMAELPDPAVWVGELYLELHRGTFTSQVATKQGNRRSEHLLREAELWWTMVMVQGLGDYPWVELTGAWRSVLLGQFHDVLPGTSIAWVHRENAAMHAELATQLEALIEEAQALLAGDGDELIRFNGAPNERDGVPALSASYAAASSVVNTEEDGRRIELSNGTVTAVFEAGLLVSLTGANGREVIPAGAPAGMLHLIPDFPNMWDAWDTERFQREEPEVIDGFSMALEERNGAPAVITRTSFRNSAVELAWGLDGAELTVDAVVDWHDQDRLLKLVLPLDLHTTRAAFETQFGHFWRDIHENTSWDFQRFEVSTHRFVHVGEPDFGVGIANSGSHGLDVLRRPHDGGGTYLIVRPSLVRGPRYPDPEADQGRHVFGFSVLVDAQLGDTVAAGYRRNLQARTRPGRPVAPLLSVQGALVEGVKPAEDRSGDVIVRLYEPTGSQSVAAIEADFAQLTVTNILEDEHQELDVRRTAVGWEIPLRPFQLLTLRLRKEAHA